MGLGDTRRVESRQEGAALRDVPGLRPLQREAAAPNPTVMSPRWRGSWRDPLRRRMLAVADVLGAFGGIATAAILVSGDQGWFVAGLLAVPAYIILAKLHGLYDRDHRVLRHLTTDELPSILSWAATGTAAWAVILSLTTPGELSAAAILRVWGASLLWTTLARGVARALWRRLTPRERALLIGSGPVEHAARRKLELFRDIHLELAGSLDDASLEGRHMDAMRAVMAEASGPQGVDRVIVASATLSEPLLAELVGYCQARHIKLNIVPPLRGMFGTAVRLDHIAELPMIAYHTWDVSRSTVVLKRVLDLVVATVALVLLWPLLLALAVLIRLDSPGPALFVQRRCGLNGTPFPMFKFRTMVADAELRLAEVVLLHDLTEPAFKVVDDPRMTRLGRLLRRWSLDELPQLLNIVRGEMSLVGPRPEQVEVVQLYSPEHLFRMNVKPGLTGPMQVYGRGALRFDERLAVERDYVEGLSVGRDLRILLLTVPAVLRGRGAF